MSVGQIAQSPYSTAGNAFRRVTVQELLIGDTELQYQGLVNGPQGITRFVQTTRSKSLGIGIDR